MGILGFPSETELSSMMGYVTDEDRDKWARMKASSDKQIENSRNGLTARGLASQSAAPAISMAEKSINAQMHGEQMADRERRRKEGEEEVEVTETRKRTRFFDKDSAGTTSASGHEMGF
ncbi:hypothetical protein [Cryobacterium zhongshanensis]|uniref:Uncharacterized protein n=1 Tax=Cryobacterium zhongshanensis TaxID=2928153 RepID=A0AA41QZE6_9MICO|nr:hypothetical protein [Cryobacterium zhongshanensis]MCI4659599.1 hypothetical protein [Cryobacterium zhongshanensis]